MKNGWWIIGVLAVIVILLFFNPFLGSIVINPPIEVPFEYKGYSGIGNYQTVATGNKEGSGGSSISVASTELKINAYGTGEVYGSPSGYSAGFSLNTGSISKVCVNSVSIQGKRDCNSAAELNICDNSKCVTIQQSYCDLDGCTDSDDNCFSTNLVTNSITGKKYLEVDNGFEKKLYEADLDESSISLKGHVTTRIFQHAQCSASLTITELIAEGRCVTVSNADLLDYISKWVNDEISNTELLSKISCWAKGG